MANSELGGLIKIAESLRIKGLGDVSQRDPASSPPPYQQHSSAQYTSAKHKRAVSPTNDTFPFNNNNGGNSNSNSNNNNCTAGNNGRAKKVPRRSYPNSSSSSSCLNNNSSNSITTTTSTATNTINNNSGLGTVSGGIDESLKAAAVSGVFHPDFTALLTAANSYTHGLAVNFPALAAVSAAAAAEYNRQVSN